MATVLAGTLLIMLREPARRSEDCTTIPNGTRCDPVDHGRVECHQFQCAGGICAAFPVSKGFCGVGKRCELGICVSAFSPPPPPPPPEVSTTSQLLLSLGIGLGVTLLGIALLIWCRRYHRSGTVNLSEYIDQKGPNRMRQTASRRAALRRFGEDRLSRYDTGRKKRPPRPEPDASGYVDDDEATQADMSDIVLRVTAGKSGARRGPGSNAGPSSLSFGDTEL